MPLTSKISAYDPAWPLQFEEERARLGPAFSDDLIEMHHVGSTAVSHLAAKPEIDLLIIVRADGGIERYVEPLARLGYRRGGDLSEGHHFFKRDVNGLRTHKLHICREGHPQIERMLRFRDILRTNQAARDAYQDLKLRLEKDNTEGIGEYLRGKAPFIDKALRG